MSRSLHTLGCWVEAMRLRTLPVSVAGVITAAALAVGEGCFQWLPWTLCLIFAVLAQIASNFANEYFDYRDGLDRVGRDGPRRGVTEGDITPGAMLVATFATLGLAACVGLSLICWGGWWLLVAGICIVAGALAYSTGPLPLSRVGLGEVAVIIFFGIAPVTLTFYVQAHYVAPEVWLAAISVGLLGANVLIVNNYRDVEDDRAVGKRTLAVRFGARTTAWMYLTNGIAAVALMYPMWTAASRWWMIIPLFTLAIIYTLWRRLLAWSGRALNPLLGMTSVTMLAYSLLFLICKITG